MSLQQTATRAKTVVNRTTTVIKLKAGKTTTVHIVRYDRGLFKPKVIAFKKATYLVDWCEENGNAEAIVGGFFLRKTNEILGDTWVKGIKQNSVPVLKPWSRTRGSVYINDDGKISIGKRNNFPSKPSGDLLQAGPMLVQDGISQIVKGRDNEGVSNGSRQFDSDITVGRHPRAAIGLDKDYIWSVVCDGRNKQDAGMTLQELADVMIKLGAQDALNLDGGASAVQVSGGKMRNHSRGDGQEYPKGRPIYSAIIFEQI